MSEEIEVKFVVANTPDGDKDFDTLDDFIAYCESVQAALVKAAEAEEGEKHE